MSRHTHTQSAIPLRHLHLDLPVSPAVIFFSMILFMVSLGDALMSYIVPVVMTEHLTNEFLMGIVLATSSAVGIGSDLIFGQKFRRKKYSFFLWWTFVTALLFPVVFILLPPAVPVFVLGMAIWGIYYELIIFGNFHFVHTFVKPDQHAITWGLLSTFKAVAYTVGPLIASLLIARGDNFPFYGSIGLYAFAALGLFLFVQVYKKGAHEVHQDEHEPKRSVLHELVIWKAMLGRIWHLLLFCVTLSIVDATFWSVGAVLSENLGGSENGMLLVVYGLPSLFFGVLAGRAARPLGKKRAAFISGALSGVALFFAGGMPDVSGLLLLVFVSSSFLAITIPEVYAVFEDYVSRLGKTGNDLIGLQSAMTGIAYIIGPITAGAIATMLGPQQTFSVMGLLLAAVSVFSLIVVPRKIRLPQSELIELAS